MSRFGQHRAGTPMTELSAARRRTPTAANRPRVAPRSSRTTRSGMKGSTQQIAGACHQTVGNAPRDRGRPSLHTPLHRRMLNHDDPGIEAMFCKRSPVISCSCPLACHNAQQPTITAPTSAAILVAPLASGRARARQLCRLSIVGTAGRACSSPECGAAGRRRCTYGRTLRPLRSV
jgi:hypothetical protein